MKIEPTKQAPAFSYSNVLKTQWMKGNLKSVKKGFYGDTLTKKNITLEHLKPHSQGGKTSLENLVLASKQKNWLRGCEDLRKYASKKGIIEYLIQFMGIRLKNFNGDEYIANIVETLKTLGIEL